jgi:uncharacterized protein YukE
VEGEWQDEEMQWSEMEWLEWRMGEVEEQMKRMEQMVLEVNNRQAQGGEMVEQVRRMEQMMAEVNTRLAQRGEGEAQGVAESVETVKRLGDHLIKVMGELEGRVDGTVKAQSDQLASLKEIMGKEVQLVTMQVAVVAEELKTLKAQMEILRQERREPREEKAATAFQQELRIMKDQMAALVAEMQVLKERQLQGILTAVAEGEMTAMVRGVQEARAEIAALASIPREVQLMKDQMGVFAGEVKAVRELQGVFAGDVKAVRELQGVFAGEVKTVRELRGAFAEEVNSVREFQGRGASMEAVQGEFQAMTQRVRTCERALRELQDGARAQEDRTSKLQGDAHRRLVALEDAMRTEAHEMRQALKGLETMVAKAHVRIHELSKKSSSSGNPAEVTEQLQEYVSRLQKRMTEGEQVLQQAIVDVEKRMKEAMHASAKATAFETMAPKPFTFIIPPDQQVVAPTATTTTTSPFTAPKVPMASDGATSTSQIPTSAFNAPRTAVPAELTQTKVRSTLRLVKRETSMRVAGQPLTITDTLHPSHSGGVPVQEARIAPVQIGQAQPTVQVRQAASPQP